MCACRCGIRVHLRDGDKGPEVRYIEGNPEHPLNKGVICAKGSSGIMKQYSPARLTMPLRRKPGTERGAGEFEPISWDETFQILEDRLRKIRATDPKKFALFTGRDQMQALTRPVRAPVRHAQLRRARRLLFGEHGRRNDLHDRRFVLGIRRPGPGPRQAVRHDRHCGRPPQQPAENRDLQVQARRRALHFDQPDPHRLFGDRRRMDRHQARHRRRAAARACARNHCARSVRPRLPRALHERRPAREPGLRER